MKRPWHPQPAPPMIWVRWRAGAGWSIWHRTTPAIDVAETRVLGVSVPRINVRESLEDARVTSCGILLRLDAALEERYWLDLTERRRCPICVRRYMSPTLPPLGSPGGGPGRERRRMVILASRGRRRPLNQPWL